MTPSRWLPTSEAEIQAALDDGLLTESHYLDMKRQVGDTPKARKETARDLASFAIDGGALLIGIAEHKDSEPRWTLHPQPLEGLAERLEQVATSVIDPPLYIVSHPVPAAAGNGRGYLLVEIPPSARAPHMVEGTYYGRGDKTKMPLSDPAVLGHHARRESERAIADRLLDTEVARDPIGDPGRRTCGRLYAIAQPLSASPTPALDLVRSSDGDLRRLLTAADAHVPQDLRGVDPGLGMLQTMSRRAHGVALSSYVCGGPGRTLQPTRGDAPPNQESMLDVEFREDGGIRFLAGRLTAEWGSRFSGGQEVERERVILDALAVTYGIRLAAWTALVGDASGYRGQWVLGLHGTDLRGLSSYRFRQNGIGWSERGEAYDADDYRESTVASHLELTERPQIVAERLVGRLLRALGVEHLHETIFVA